MVMGMARKTKESIEYVIAYCTCHHYGGNTASSMHLWILEAAYHTWEYYFDLGTA